MLPIDWPNIDTVLLDMDGTLLDLHFDNYFWQEYVPAHYAKNQQISIDEAKDQLLKRYKRIEGTLNWYCVDHWTKDLGLDIVLLKQEVSHLICVHPHVLDFLAWLKTQGKKRVLITNAHQKSLQIKMEKTELQGHLDEVFSAHELGHAKEDQAFWKALQAQEHFDKKRTLFIDDSPSVLESAQQYGIQHLLAISKPDSKQPPRSDHYFPAIENFSSLLSA